MVWARFEDRFPWHRKVRRLHDSAFRLHVSAVCWCSEHLTDGDIHADELDMVSDTRNPSRHAAQLVAVGLWDQTEWGWRIHDFLTYNPSKAQVTEEREWNKRRAALSRNPELRDAIRIRDKGRCRYCGQSVVWNDRRGPRGGTYDHVIPRGPDTLDNLVVACRACNSGKQNRTPDEAGMPLLPPGTKIASGSYLGRRSRYVQDPDPTRPDPPPFQGGEGRGRLKAVPPTPTANQPRCDVHPHELAHNCRSCAADMKAGGL